jgi:preprotein translocase subunit SecD
MRKFVVAAIALAAISLSLSGRATVAADLSRRVVTYELKRDFIRHATVFEETSYPGGGTPTYCVRINLTPQATKGFAQLTKSHIEEEMHVVFDGDVIATPIIREQISSGILEVRCWNELKSAKRLTRRLNRE